MIFRIQHIVCLAIVMLSTLVHAQSKPAVDSLNQLLIKESLPEKRIDLFQKIAYQRVLLGDYNLAILNIEEAINEAELSGFEEDVIGLKILKINYLIEVEDISNVQLYIDNIRSSIQKKPLETRLERLNQLWPLAKRASAFELSVEILEELSDLYKGQNDSLMAVSKENVGTIYLLNLGGPNRAIEEFEKVFEIFEELGHEELLGDILNKIGNAYIGMGEYAKAHVQYTKALDYYQAFENQRGIARAFNNLGETYRYRGNYAQALENYLKSLKFGELLQDTMGISVYVSNIGIIYYEQGKLEDAIRFFNQSLDYSTKSNFTPGMIETYNYLGLVYKKQGDFDAAVKNFEQSLSLSSKFGDKVGEALSYNSLGGVNLEKGFFDSALKNFNKALEIADKSENVKGQVQAMLGMSNVYYEASNYSKALEMLEKLTVLASRADLKPQLMDAYLLFSKCYEKRRDFRTSLNYHYKYSELSDTLNSFRVSQRLDAMESAFLTESREREMRLLRKEKELQRIELERNQAELEKKETQQQAVIIGLIFLIILIIVVLIAYNERKKAFEKMRNQKLLIETKNRDITDSIQYAKIIQEAILPAKDYLKTVLNDYFAFYKAKDIVSGDFFWVYQSTRNKQIIAAVVDCTGHGVPGAFMSMIGVSLLNEIVIKSRVRKPGLILDLMREEVKKALRQDGGGNTHDGMDAAIVALDRTTGKLEFAGANNSLFLVSGKKLTEYKGNKQPIGFFSGNYEPFETTEILTAPGDLILLSSDGYYDQFGGKHNKKFKKSNFKKLLEFIAPKSTEEQYEKIVDEHQNWINGYEQIDDICVLGFKV